MEHWQRDKRIWRILWTLLHGWLCRKFSLTAEAAEPEGPCLVLSNHATDWDPLLVAMSFKNKHMYYVASEHIFRWGFLWKLINWLLHPISRLKGDVAADTVMTVMRRMRRGASVAIFAEGDRTWDGRTGDILPSTGKLARACGGSLVTYRLTGGYLTSPRWAGKSLRRGPMHGAVVGVYTREQLRSMTPEQVNGIISRDLFEDACARQRREMAVYEGKNKAEGLETMLCLCPKCGALGAMRSRGDRFFCLDCGFEVLYTSQGFLQGEDSPFDCVPDWDAWQTARLRELAEAGEGRLFSDGDAALARLLPGHGAQELGSGEVWLSREALCAAGRAFPLGEISGMGMHGPLALCFTHGGEHYELTAPRPACLRKYMTIYNILREKARSGKETVEVC